MSDKENSSTLKKPIDKEYLKSTLQNFKQQVLDQTYTTHTHDNKDVLDKIGISNNNTLLFNGEEIKGGSSSAGKSAYQIAVDNGFVGSESEWLESLIGADGLNGKDGVNGKSAYEIAVDNSFTGTESEWLESLKGRDGTNGTNGIDGRDGENGEDGSDGLSAYEIAVRNGFTGTEQEWLNSLKGEDGNQIDAYTKKETDEKFITAPQIWTGTNQFKFGVDENGNYGYYKDGADTVTPFLNLSDSSIKYAYAFYVPMGIGGFAKTITINKKCKLYPVMVYCVCTYKAMSGTITVAIFKNDVALYRNVKQCTTYSGLDGAASYIPDNNALVYDADIGDIFDFLGLLNFPDGKVFTEYAQIGALILLSDVENPFT